MSQVLNALGPLRLWQCAAEIFFKPNLYDEGIGNSKKSDLDTTLPSVFFHTQHPKVKKNIEMLTGKMCVCAV